MNSHKILKSLVEYRIGILLFLFLSMGLWIHSSEQEAKVYPRLPAPLRWEPTDTIWNLGLASTCDIGPEEPEIHQFIAFNPAPVPNFRRKEYEKLRPGDVVWMRSLFVPIFNQEMLPEIKVPIVVLIVDGDDSFPSRFVNRMDVDKFIQNDKIIHIFAQNCDYNGPTKKVSHMPIGIDFHSVYLNKGGFWGMPQISPRQQESVMKEILKSSPPTGERILKAFVDFQHKDTMRSGDQQMYIRFGEDRTSIFNRLLPTNLIDHGPKLPRHDLWRTKGKYAFSISPHGNGLDCHRTWEDLYLGCIVIVKTSPLDPMYEGLPVVIVKDWDEVTKENMEKWLKQYGDASTNPAYREKLTMAYWRNKIDQAAKPYKDKKKV